MFGEWFIFYLCLSTLRLLYIIYAYIKNSWSRFLQAHLDLTSFHRPRNPERNVLNRCCCSPHLAAAAVEATTAARHRGFAEGGTGWAVPAPGQRRLEKLLGSLSFAELGRSGQFWSGCDWRIDEYN